MALKVIEFQDLGDFAMNCYLIICESTRQALIVDPGAAGERLVAGLKQQAISQLQIFLTHAHIDHVGAVAAVRQHFTAPCWLPCRETELYQGVTKQCEMFGIAPIYPEKEVTLYDEGTKITIGETTGVTLLTPGHSPGSSCLWLESSQQLFSGDLIFQGSIGRMDLWGGDPQAMTKSLKRLESLPASTKIYPGHGPTTTLAHERQHNPYLQNLR